MSMPPPACGWVWAEISPNTGIVPFCTCYSCFSATSVCSRRRGQGSAQQTGRETIPKPPAATCSPPTETRPERAERHTSLKGKAESTVLAAISDPLGTGFFSPVTAGLAQRALARFIAELVGQFLGLEQFQRILAEDAGRNGEAQVRPGGR